MPHLKASDIRTFTPEELKEKLDGLKKELFSLRLQARLGKLEKHSTIQKTRKDIARVLTVLREKQSTIHGNREAKTKT